MNNTVQRSTFVTVLAWIFIALSGFATLISILQNIIFRTIFNRPEVHQAMQNPPPDMPPIALFMFSHLNLFLLSFLLISSITLIISIGLLLRKNWARLGFIGLMVFAILWNLSGIVLQVFMTSYMKDQIPTTPDMPDMSIFFIAIVVVSAIFAIGFSILFGWIARKLMTPVIVAEFTR